MSSAPALLRTRGLTKRYPAVTAVDGLDVEVPAGRVGLVGANGAGKTTLFRMMLGVSHPTSGSLEVCGIDVAKDPIGVRSLLGYMPEHDCLPLDQTAADVVSTFGELSGLPARAARQRASDVLDLVGLDEARFRPVGGFSTGMRQRTKLAQALVADPELVLLDEPTAGLDPLGREEMLDLVARLGGLGISVLLATHLLDDVQQVCDHVIMLDGGRLVVSGSTSGLLERTGVLTVDVGPDRDGLVALLADRGPPGGGRHRAPWRCRSQGDDDIDRVRDAVADLGLPLHRMTTRLTSLDDVFLDKATHQVVGADGRRRLRPGVPRLRGRAGRAVSRPGRAVPRVDPPGPRHPPAVATEGRPGDPARPSPPCRPSCSSGVGYVTRDTIASDFEWITYREYVGVSSYLLVFVALTAPDIMCPDRRQRVLPVLFARPLTGADYVIAKVGGDVRDRVRVLVPPPGGALRRPDAGERATAPSATPRDNAEVHLAGAGRGEPCCRSTTRRSAWRSRRSPRGGSSPARTIIGLLLVSSHREQRARRAAREPPATSRAARGDHRRVHDPHRGRRGDRGPERRGGLVRRRRRVAIDARARPPAALFNLLTLPLVVRDLVFLGEVEDGPRAVGARQRWAVRAARVRGRADRRASSSSSVATTRSSDDGSRHPPPRPRPRPRPSTPPSSPTPRWSRTTCRCGSARRWRCPS